jgi:hypothetical protein
MKTLLMGALALAVSAGVYAQDVIYFAKVKREEVPVAVVNSIETDFPGSTVIDYYGIPVDLVEDAIFVNLEQSVADRNYDTYTISLTGKGRELIATYNRDGKLIGEREILKDVALPRPIQKAIGKDFPAYAVTGDHVMMTAHKGDHQKVMYKVHLAKGNEKVHAIFDANGNLLKGMEHSSRHMAMAKRHNMN